MPLQATSGAASYDAFGGGVPVVPAYIEEVFSCFLYTGNGTSQTITNGIDLSTKGGLVWIKPRNAANGHSLFTTVLPNDQMLATQTTDPLGGVGGGQGVRYTTSGFTVGGFSDINRDLDSEVSWTFRKAPKFFDVVTYTGDSVFDRVISHNLDAVPAVIIIKCTSSATDWVVRTTAIDGSMDVLFLNLTNAKIDSSVSNTWTSSTFTVGAAASDNQTGQTYVAYLFASNAGGFGLTGTDNVISCGSFTGNTTVTLGYEPQWIMLKRVDNIGSWDMHDVMRGWPVSGDAARLRANLSDAEGQTSQIYPNATGFSTLIGSGDYIYIAIRRGPMKVPTSGTSVYNGITRTGTGADATVTGVGFAPDLAWIKDRGGNFSTSWDRLRGATKLLRQTGTSAEETFTDALTGFDVMDGVRLGTDNTAQYINLNAATYINWNFRRAPSFFDEVCYTGDGVDTRMLNHNLNAQPELIISKNRQGVQNWQVIKFAPAVTTTSGTNYWIQSISTAGSVYDGTINSTFGPSYSAPTSTQYPVGIVSGNTNAVNASGITYVAYLFATCAGVSKCFNYTGNGSSQTINCGFTGGARWILIKRTDSTGDWYCWDSARGIVSGNDPHLSLNTTAAEVTSDDTIDTDSTGFVVNQVSATNVNVSSATYIGIAIA